MERITTVLNLLIGEGQEKYMTAGLSSINMIDYYNYYY
jgi:hypothetical protein